MVVSTVSRLEGGGRKGTLDHDRVLGALGDAYRIGYVAFVTGDAYRSDNPYKRGTGCRHMWHNGWTCAERDKARLASLTLVYTRALETDSGT